MKNILIIETASSYRGVKERGSYLQAIYYENLLKQNGYKAKLYVKDKHVNKFINALKIIVEIRKSDFILGFGTPLLQFYLQWICFFLEKKGLFCIDTIIVPFSIIYDHFKRRIFSLRLIFSNIKKIILDKNIINIVPPKLPLIPLVSCRYVKNQLSNSPYSPLINHYVYPKVVIPKNSHKTIFKKKNKSVLFYGHLFRGRGIVDLVKACRLLWDKKYYFKLVILGYPVVPISKKTLIRIIKKTDMRKIIFKEYVSDVYAYVRKTTMVVLPFRYPCSFQTPYTLLEPMGMGVPVITTNVGSHGEWVKHGETGFICEKENPEDIARKIELVFNDKKLVKKITEGAYKLLEERYKEKDVIMDLLEKLENER